MLIDTTLRESFEQALNAAGIITVIVILIACGPRKAEVRRPASAPASRVASR